MFTASKFSDVISELSPYEFEWVEGPGVESVAIRGASQNLCVCFNGVSISVTANVHLRKGLPSVMPKFLEDTTCISSDTPHNCNTRTVHKYNCSRAAIVLM